MLLSIASLLAIQFLLVFEPEALYVPILPYLYDFDVFLYRFPILKSVLSASFQFTAIGIAHLAFRRAILEKINSKFYILSFLVAFLCMQLWTQNFWYSAVLLLLCSSIYQLNLFSLGHNSSLRIFNAGIFIGLATILLPSSVLLLTTVVLAMMAYNDLSLRNLLQLLLGFVGPLYLLIAVLYLDDHLFQINYLIAEFPLSADTLNYSLAITPLISLALFGLLLVLSVVFTLFSLGSINVQSRRTLNFYLFNATYFLVLFGLGGFKNALPLLFIIPFASVFIAHALSLGKRTFFLIDILFTLLIAGIIIQFTF